MNIEKHVKAGLIVTALAFAPCLSSCAVNSGPVVVTAAPDVEPKEETEEFREEAPALTPPFYMDTQLEEAPVREKIGAPGSGEGKPRRRHRGGRRRSGGRSAEGAGQPKAEAKGPEQKEGRTRPPKQESRPAPPKPAEARPGENRAAAPGGEGEAKRRRRPHHRGGRRRNKNGGEGGSAPKSE